MSAGPLPISDVVQVTVSAATLAIAPESFNQGLIVGPSTHIPSYGANARLQQFANTAAILSAGFANSDPEYLAAEAYFGQASVPSYVWIGRQDLTAIQTAVPAGRKITDAVMSSSSNPTYLNSATASFISGDVGAEVIVVGAGTAGADLITTIATISSATVAVLVGSCLTTVSGATAYIGAYGINYKANDVIGVTQGGASNGLLIALTTGPDGQVLTLGTTIGNQGTGYSVANNLATYNGSGTGLKVNITAAGETYLQAVEACATFNDPWYPVFCCGASDSDHLALAAWSNANWQTGFYVGSSTTTGIESGTPGNIALEIQALDYKSLLTFGTTQGGTYPNNIYEGAAVMGLACGLNTGLAGSYFTLNMKKISTVAPEPVSESQENAILGAYCNFVGTWGPYIGYFRSGVLGSGDFFDQILFRAMLVNEIQINIMNILTSTPSVPQTDPGEHQLITAVEQACQNLASIGYIGPGAYTGAPLLNLITGQSLPLGYIVQAQSYAVQNAGDRAARKAMPIYATILEAGAVHTVQVSVNVQL